MRRRLLVMAIGLVVGCSNGSEPRPPYLGTWHLSLVNEHPLPATLNKPDPQECADVATGGTIEFAADHTYSVTIEFEPKTGCASSYSTAGHYTRAEDFPVLSMSNRGNDDPRAFVFDSEITILHAVDLYTFTR
jgi:hypothetical protein